MHIDNEVGPGEYETSNNVKKGVSGGSLCRGRRFMRANQYKKIVPGPG